MRRKKENSDIDAKKYGVLQRGYNKVVDYPFKRWLSKPVVILKKGRDYCLNSFRLAPRIRRHAVENGVEISIKAIETHISITVWDRVK
jgi:hypothetical protein